MSPQPLRPIRGSRPERTDIEAALHAARVLVSWGIPAFLAKPARDRHGAWLPAGGHQETGYWFPREWQKTRPDPAVIDRWRPGMALCAVMGHALDLLDIDPRNGGDTSRAELIDQGIWPSVLFEAASPSGGTHEFVAPLGIRSKNDARPGLDVKAGVDGGGHGFAFIAPTIRASKASGQPQAYRWIRPPSGPRPQRDGSGDRLAALIRPVVGPRTRRRSGSSTGPADTSSGPDRIALLESLPTGQLPCAAMLAQVDVIGKAMANGSRHAALLGPLLRLLVLAKTGHQGLRRALELVESDFVARVADARSGEPPARIEFARSLDGAMERVLGPGGEFPRDVACDCFLAALTETATEPRLFSRGSKGVTERKVLSYLHLAARQRRSQVVAESQRQIAEATETSRAVVARALDRLEDLGWLRRMAAADILAPNPVRLLLPDMCRTVPTERRTSSSTASFSVGITLHGRVHRLFGSQGLGGGPAETLAALAERTGPPVRRRSGLPRGRLIQVTPGSCESELLANPWQGPRQIPRPSPGGGRTINEIARATAKHRSTISRHLKKLEDRGLVFQDESCTGETLWWRLRFDPDQIADRDQIPDTAEAKAIRHKRQRQAFLVKLSKQDGSNIKRVRVAGGTALVDSRSGEVADVLSDDLLEQLE